MPERHSCARGSHARSATFVLLLVGCGAAARDDDSTTIDGAVEPLARARAALSEAARPPGVPAEFVITPFGYMHPSCVIAVAEDEAALENGAIEREDGRSRQTSTCRYPRFDGSGREIPDDGPPPARQSGLAPASVAAFDGWVESANSADNGPLNWISANWTVPPSPTSDVGQTLYYFPGMQPLEHLGTEYTIMQPVLAYRSGTWTIESWNCCTNGNANVGPAGIVQPGDTLYGYVQGDGCDSRGVCSQWFIYTGDWTNGAQSYLRTSAYGNVMGWAFAGVLEVYGVDACDQYPPSGSITFTNIMTRSTSYQQVYPSWNTGVTSAEPQCDYGVSAPSSSTVTLFASP